MHRDAWGLLALAVAAAEPAMAQQRAQENATRSADDAFGVQVGNDRSGLYTDRDARGFSPLSAGNARIEGMYFATTGMVSRVLSATTIRVGLTAQNYPFPAPTGIVDYTLRPMPERLGGSSVVQLGPNEGYSVELDGQFPIVPDRLGFAIGLMHRNEYLIPGDQLNNRAAGITARFRPNDTSEIMAFYGYAAIQHDKFNPLVFTGGPFLPPDVEPKYFGQAWSANWGWNRAYGVRAYTKLSENWTLNLGAFHQNIPNKGLIADLYLGVDRNGLPAQHLVTNELPIQTPGVSGEARLTGVHPGERLRHTLHLNVRGRRSERNFGGAASALIAPIPVGQRIDLPEPAWNYGVSSLDQVRQWSLGAQYQIAWRGLGEASIGVQQVDYEKTVTPPLGASRVTVDRPLFVNGSLALTLTKRLVAYSSFTRGLEEAPLAPENALNAQEAPPAIHTEQYDVGLRYALTPGLRLVAGYFSVSKPYFNLDPGRVYRSLGEERHRGFEISLAGRLSDRLNVVAGAVLQKPEVTGEGVDAGVIGPRPVSQPETVLRINLDYRTPWVEGLSLDATFVHTGERAATARRFAELGGEQLDAEAFTTLDLGMRYRYRLANRPSTMRVQLVNAFNDTAWRILPSGAFTQAQPRTLQVTLATDF